jgi:hypothetical protein
MRDCRRFVASAAAVVLILVLVLPAEAQIEDQISVYTGDNAVGYLEPFSDAVGATLNTGFFRSAYLPTTGFNIGFEILLMGLYFGNDDKTFDATTEGPFTPVSTQTVPTVIGDGDAVLITGNAGTGYAFPGGLSLNSFAMLAPQLRISSLRGTEFVARYGRVKSGDAEVGDVTLYGFGLRHNISQYFREDFPVDMSVGGIYQKFKGGENSDGNDLMDSDLLSIGGNVSKRFPIGFATFEPYGALSYDSYQMTLDYSSDTAGQQTIDFDRVNTAHLALGVNFNLKYANIYAEYNIAKMQSFGVGLALGALGY